MAKPGIDPEDERRARIKDSMAREESLYSFKNDSERIQHYRKSRNTWRIQALGLFGVVLTTLFLGGAKQLYNASVEKANAEAIYTNLPPEIASEYDSNRNGSIEPREAVKLFQDYTVQERAQTTE
jgi:hypothetical protein